MLRALVFGASGQIGRPLLARLRRDGWDVVAVSRTPHADAPGVRWVQGGFPDIDGLPHGVDALVSCGPLDGFAAWHAAHDVGAACVVAFGSTSVHVKADSADAGERDVAARLLAGERSVLATADARGVRAVILRPTLVYGSGRDRTLSRIAALAQRWGCFVLPRGATGLRQPVHVDDLADAALAALQAPAARDAFDLPGGEAVPYRDMIRRVLATLQPSPRLHEVPAPLFATAVALARATGRLGGFGDAALARLRQDLVFDASPARAGLGYAPRPFSPTAAMFSVD
jgi:nucleoside-diphosphate-sugar epimerase